MPVNFPGSPLNPGQAGGPQGQPGQQQQQHPNNPQSNKNQARNNQPKKNRTPSCYNCGDQGHDAENCRDQSKSFLLGYDFYARLEGVVTELLSSK